MTEKNDGIEALAARLALVEDELAIMRLVASYGPFVDCGATDLAPALFSRDGVYDVDAMRRFEGRTAISDMLAGDEHQGFVGSGIAHAMGLPWVCVEGDRAVATNVTQIFLRDGEGYRIFRIAQNVWTLDRTAEGWKVVERRNRLIGDDGEAVALLRGATGASRPTAL